MIPPTIAIITNAHAADQRSMIGYGELLMDAARKAGARVIEWRATSLFARLPLRGRWQKLALNVDRFVVTPLTMLGRKADIVHVADPGNCVYLPLTRHKCAIVTVHDMIPYLAAAGQLKGFSPTLTGRLLMAVILRQLARVDHIICVSHATRRDLLQIADVLPERVSVLHNAVFQPMAPASAEVCRSFRARYGIPADAEVVLHVGRNFYKNRTMVLDVFARVHAEIPQVRLVLVGTLESTLREQVARLGISDDVLIFDEIPREDMAALYTTSAVLFFPSLYEGFGLPVLEAQMCGTPVVCSDAGSLKEVAGSTGITAAPSDIEAFVQGIRRAFRRERVEGPSTPPHSLNAMDWYSSMQRVYQCLGEWPGQ